MRKEPLLLFILLLVWLGCDPKDKSGCKEVKTMTLNPAVIDTVSFNKHGGAKYSCWPVTCFHTYGLGCSITVDKSKEVQVGYDYVYDNGTLPCNCWWYKDCVFRGGVRFDLGALKDKGIVGATLKWSNRGSCAANLYVPDQPWGIFDLLPSNKVSNPWPPGSSGPGKIEKIEIGITVRNWVLGTEPNYGWLFVGPDESFANYAWKEGDFEIGSGLEGTNKCTSSVKGFQLDVKYTD